MLRNLKEIIDYGLVPKSIGQSRYFGTSSPARSTPYHRPTLPAYFENARMIFAEICKKKIDAMKESESTSTINGSLLRSDGVISMG
jgi:hypothetical protein